MPNLTDVMKKSEAYSTREIADLLQINETSARQRLNRAHDKGVIIRRIVRNKTYWAIKP